MSRIVLTIAAILLASHFPANPEEPFHSAELVFPLESWHNHGSSLVELPNGDIFAVWYHGSGERRADDVLIQAARLPHGQRRWRPRYTLADVPGFPDCNVSAFIDSRNRLWIIWPTIVANLWETALLNYRITADLSNLDAPPRWDVSENLLFQLPGFDEKVRRIVEPQLALAQSGSPTAAALQATLKNAGDKYFRRMGWMPRAHPIELSNGRIIVPLYSDGFSFSVMAISDDFGRTWTASEPLAGRGSIQPSIAAGADGALTAYMRDNGPPPKRLHVSVSRDDGLTWSEVADSELPNPGSAAEVITLHEGSWLLIYNDTERSRHSLAVSISEDEGKTWKWTRHLERDTRGKDAGSFHYPSIIQARDGSLHATYSYFLNHLGKESKSIKHARFNVAWVKQGDPPPAPAAEIRVDPGEVVRKGFMGPGFHVFFHLHDFAEEEFDQVLGKRWRELNPTFARLTHRWASHDPITPDEKSLRALSRVMNFMNETTGTEVYLTTWNPPQLDAGPARESYASLVAGDIERLRREGATNLNYYCMTNELSYGGWAGLKDDLPTFRDYHRLLHAEFERRGLPVKLLATDASPIANWKTLEWAAANMDSITGVYGGHHYINRHSLDDLSFYGYFREHTAWGAALARRHGKDFIIGEFGARQDNRFRHGRKRDECIYWDKPAEAWVGIQIAEAVLAAMNSGVHSLSYWTFTDFPDDYRPDYINKWGVFQWGDSGWRTRDVYYAYGLLTKFFRGPATVFKTEVSGENIRAAAAQLKDGSWSVAVINRNPGPASVTISLPAAGDAAFRKYVYDPADVPFTEDGDLPEPDALVTMTAGALTGSVPPGTLAVYTTAFDTEPPPPVEGLEIHKHASGGRTLTWTASPAPDLCYYRIYKNGNRIGSTIATSFTDRTSGPGEYRVIAVDTSGN